MIFINFFFPFMVFKISVISFPCGNCSWSYIGETGRSFATRKKEHARNVKTAAKGSRIANHSWSQRQFSHRKGFGFLATTITPNADNNSCSLPRQYSILVNKHSLIMYYSLILLYCFLVFSQYIFFRIFDLFIISPVEDCSSGGRKLVSFYILSQRTFFNSLTIRDIRKVFSHKHLILKPLTF